MATILVPPSTEFSDSEGSGRAGPNRREREARGSAPEQDPPGRGRRRSRPGSEQEKGKSKGKSKGGGKKGKKGSKEGRSNSGGKKGEKGDGKKGKRQEPQPDMRTIIQQEMAKMIPMAASMLGMMNPVSLNPMAMGSAGPSTGLTHASTEAAPPGNPAEPGWYEDANQENWYWHGKGWWSDWRPEKGKSKGSDFSHDSSIRSVRPAGNVRRVEESAETPAAPVEPKAAPAAPEKGAATKKEIVKAELQDKRKPVKSPPPLAKKEETSPRRKEARTRPAEDSPPPAAGESSGQRPEAPKGERGAPRKKVKAEPKPDPPDGGDDEPDWDESEYSYTYETDPGEGEAEEGERNPESEVATVDPTVSVSGATNEWPFQGEGQPRREGRQRPPEPAGVARSPTTTTRSEKEKSPPTRWRRWWR